MAERLSLDEVEQCLREHRDEIALAYLPALVREVARLRAVAAAAQAREANPKDPQPWNDLRDALAALEVQDA